MGLPVRGSWEKSLAEKDLKKKKIKEEKKQVLMNEIITRKEGHLGGLMG